MPRPRERTFGAVAGGGGPIMASSGSESEADEAAYFLPFVDPSFVSENIVFLFFLGLAELRVPLSWNSGESGLRKSRRR